MSDPRILVATEFPPLAAGGGPAVIRQMLRGFPGEVHWWSVFPGRGETTEFRLGECGSPRPPGRLYPYKTLPRVKSALMESLWAPAAASHLRSQISRLKPDCVWVIPHNWSIPVINQVLRGLQQRRHTTVQDYVDVHDNPERFGRSRCHRFAGMADDLYAKAETRDATSLPMLEDLLLRTGAKGAQMLHQGLEAEDFRMLEMAEPLDSATGQPIRICYAGTILVMDEFRAFVTALSKAQLKTRVELHFFGAHAYAQQSWFRPDWMFEHGNLGDRDLLCQLRTMDWGFVPMSTTDHDPRYNRFSFPTKFITYIAAGLPIIALGHPESSVIRMMDQYSLGITLKTSEVPAIVEKLSILDRGNAKRALAPALLQCGRDQFDAERMRRQLWQCLIPQSLMKV